MRAGVARQVWRHLRSTSEWVRQRPLTVKVKTRAALMEWACTTLASEDPTALLEQDKGSTGTQ